MACNCSTGSTPVQTYGSSACPTVTSSGPCSLPVRSSNPPVIPVVFNWTARMRPLSSGRVVVNNGDELGVLDAPFSGTVQFDVSTGTVFVGSYAATSVADTDACSASTPMYGQLLLGRDPGPHELGLFPDRTIGVTRLVDGNKGFMWGFLQSCPQNPVNRPEIAPVRITPAAMPSTIPAGLRIPGYVITDSETPCGGKEVQWYEVSGPLPVDSTNLALTTIPDEPLDADSNNTLRFTVYEKNETTGQWELKSLDNPSLQAFFASQNANSVRYLTPRATVFDQTSTTTYAQAVVVDLRDQPQFFENAKEVQMHVTLTLSSGGLEWDNALVVDGVDKINVTGGPDGRTQSYQITVPVRTNKQMVLNLTKNIHFAGAEGPFGGSRFKVDIEAFR